MSGLEYDPMFVLEPVLPWLGLAPRKVVCSTISAVELVALVTADSAVTEQASKTSDKGSPNRKFHTFFGVENTNWE